MLNKNYHNIEFCWILVK